MKKQVVNKVGVSSFRIPFEVAIEQQQPTVMWRLPENNVRHLIIDLRDKITQHKLDLENSFAGFSISPFQNMAGENSYFVHSDLHFQWKGNEINLKAHLFPKEDNLVNKREHFLEKINLRQVNDSNNFKAQVLENISQQRNYQDNVQRAIESIQSRQFDKVVLARQKFIHVSEKQDWTAQFEKLCQHYPQAFVYLFHLPAIGTWLGATPETLISVDENQIFKTMSLAGTQAFHPKKHPSQALWSQKEIEEQALVSRYIIDCFKKIRLREFQEDGPKTVVAGNLMHLRTNFKVDMQATNFPQLGTVMLELLHPTSAVCGMPKDSALQFIQENEGFDREFYSGFLGPVNIQRQSHLFVNLRCMQIQRNKGILYAGAGITADSIPSKEWNETEIKSQTLMNILQSK